MAWPNNLRIVHIVKLCESTGEGISVVKLDDMVYCECIALRNLHQATTLSGGLNAYSHATRLVICSGHIAVQLTAHSRSTRHRGSRVRATCAIQEHGAPIYERVAVHRRRSSNRLGWSKVTQNIAWHHSWLLCLKFIFKKFANFTKFKKIVQIHFITSLVTAESSYLHNSWEQLPV